MAQAVLEQAQVGQRQIVVVTRYFLQLRLLVAVAVVLIAVAVEMEGLVVEMGKVQDLQEGLGTPQHLLPRQTQTPHKEIMVDFLPLEVVVEVVVRLERVGTLLLLGQQGQVATEPHLPFLVHQ